MKRRALVFSLDMKPWTDSGPSALLPVPQGYKCAILLTALPRGSTIDLSLGPRHNSEPTIHSLYCIFYFNKLRMTKYVVPRIGWYLPSQYEVGEPSIMGLDR